MEEFRKRLNELAGRGPEGVIDLVDAVIREGLRCGASDIHIEPAEGLILVRYRLDGVLHPAVEARTPCGLNIVARVKVLADLLTYQTDTPQEGRINRDKVGASADLRASTFPTVRGEKVVLRLFDPRTQDVRLAELGYPEGLRLEMEGQLQRPSGVILLTGPAGSGKTTTIYAALRYVLDLSGGARNVVTVEDPVERMIAGITQTQVHPATGLTFARCLRSLMRQDPEVIVVGEIRDRETAEIAIEAGLTGHLVISTIHSGTTAGVFTRLLDMGVEPYLAASAVNYVVAQRLVRKLCPQCRRPAEAAGLPEEAAGKACDAAGCEACFGTGYRGRTVVAEALRMTKRLSVRIHERAATEVLAVDAVESGMRPLRDAALDALCAGITSAAEVRRVLGPEAFTA
jgi:type II secretory ATPase GspE/PulE/Tfp pilus assembly ATPase PilB-like protein